MRRIVKSSIEDLLEIHIAPNSDTAPQSAVLYYVWFSDKSALLRMLADVY